MSRHWKWRALAPWLVLSVCACSLDERELRHGGSGQGATDQGGAPSAGSGSGVPEGGEGATPGQGASSGTTGGVNDGGDGSTTPSHLPPLVGGCADLDTDGVGDCSVTLVRNPTFKTDVASWAKVGDSALDWNAKNALDDEPSGCAMLSAEGATDTDGAALFRASQCIAAGPGQLVVAYANAWVARNASPAVQAHAELQVSYFDAQDCTGSATGYFVTPPSTQAETWVTIHAGGVTGPNTKAVLVMLVGVKPYRTDNLSACFDNVMVKFKSL